MTFEEYNEPTEEKQWKIGALIQCEEITYKATVTPIIDAWKQAMFDETNNPAFCYWCPACESGECFGHTYDRYCHIDEQEKITTFKQHLGLTNFHQRKFGPYDE